jgi:phenylacetate-coenzyme A ligase PaaK-like adenylate-forming protein
VFEGYGLGELVVAAYECEQHAGFHEASELGIFEFERDKNTGLHQVLGTSLWNGVMPFIRFRIGDLVELAVDKRCACGKTLPRTLSRIIGRIDDILYAKDGTEILPVSVRTGVSPFLNCFETYQFQQIGKTYYKFILVGELEESRKAKIYRVLADLVGRSAVIDFEHSDHIATSAGKIRTVINLFRDR